MAGSDISLLSVTGFNGWRLESRRLGHGPAFQRLNQAFEDKQAIGAAKDVFACPFRMRHQACHVAALVANPGDVLYRTVRAGGVGDGALSIGVTPENLI